VRYEHLNIKSEAISVTVPGDIGVFPVWYENLNIKSEAISLTVPGDI
jgi:hypothetical protein